MKHCINLIRCISLVAAFLLLPLTAISQHRLRIVEWNVENLFDTRHDTLKNDTEFLPEGSYHWTPFRYWKKLNEIGQTLAAIGGDAGLPVLIGLCEVENDSVLFDLTCRSALHTSGYEYVMTSCADYRGVDVALVYQPLMFRLLDWHAVRVPSVKHGFKPTRDLLWVKGQLVTGDTLQLVVCHLPSKAGGGVNATRHRILAASTLHDIVDSVLTSTPNAKLIVMGDFNATQGESVFNKLLPPLHETLPTNRHELNKPIGTYYYKKQWSYLDHILISEGFLAWQKNPRAKEVRLPFLLNKKGTPNRTYLGTFYNGGISDHLPLCLDIELQ